MKCQLFPPLEPIQKGFLHLGEEHQMYWQASGNPRGEPVVWLHGGPGSSASPMHRRLFDPEKFYIVQYDQRGCGLSTPKGAINANTTDDLIKDIERLREHLEVSTWHVAGGSWGGSLGLIYAQSHAHIITKFCCAVHFCVLIQKLNATPNFHRQHVVKDGKKYINFYRQINLKPFLNTVIEFFV